MISILIIGNEILSASVEDTNLKHMLQELNQAGYSIDEVRIVRDELETIGEAIRHLSARSRFVISTGGVGPTHDDITLEAYAHAFAVPLIMHPILEQRIRAYFGDDTKASSLRMARVPENTELVEIGPTQWPLIKVANCFVLPGLPEVFLRKFENVLKQLPAVPDRYSAELYTRARETEFASELARVQDHFTNVEIGSYPTYNHSEYAARITLKSHHHESLGEVFVQLETLFSQSLVRSIRPHKSNNA